MSFHTKCLSLVTKVARNDVSDTINNIVDAGMRHLDNQPEYQRKIFQTSLDVLKDSNQQLWFNLSLKLGKIHFEMKNYTELEKMLVILK